MAEGNSQDCKIPEDILSCPICLEKFTKPKSLPCIHTFCHGCLSAYISQCTDKKYTSGFPCPICRAITSPKDISVEISTWADQFPTNSFIADVIEAISFQKTDKLCNICEKQGKSNVKGHSWCNTCKVCMCIPCQQMHDTFRPNDDILVLEDLVYSPPRAIDITVKCSKHGDRVDFYCIDHHDIGCSKCIAVDHRKCDSVVTAEEYTKTIRDSMEMKQLISGCDEQLLDIEKIVKFYIEKQKTLTVEKEESVQQILDFRQKINKHLDELETNFVGQITKMFKEEATKISEEIENCKIYQSTLEQNKKLLQTTEMFGGDAQYLATYLKFRSSSDETRKRVDSVIKSLKDVGIMFKFNSSLHQLTNTVNNFGEVWLVQKKKGGFRVGKSSSTFDKTITLERTLNVRCESDKSSARITGGLYLHDGKFILCDSDNKALKLYEETGRLVCYHSMSSMPWDICSLENSDFAVTQPSQMKIAVIKIIEDQITKDTEISTGCKCHGIAVIGDNFVITCGDDIPGTIRIITRGGKCLTVTEVNVGNPYHVAVNPILSTIIVSVMASKGQCNAIIYNSDLSENSRLTYDDLFDVLGLNVDDSGNIFLCGRRSSILKQVSCDVQKTKNVLSLDQALSIILGDEKILLSKEKSSIIHIYNLG